MTSDAKSFEDVFKEERVEIGILRQQVGRAQEDLETSLSGIAFSGGGIRSATFALGVVQALATAKLIRRFDYVSSVSGGGYLASWLGAWINRCRAGGGVKQVEHELCCPGTDRAEPPQVHFLRRYSNYLTPQVGAMSGDTWALVAIYLRNLLLNFLILVLSLATVLLLPRVVTLLVQGLKPTSPEACRNDFLLAGLLATVSIVTVGLNLRFFEFGDAEPSDRKRGRLSRPLALSVLVVMPLFCSASVLSAQLRAHESLQWTCWECAVLGVVIHLVGWMIGSAAAKLKHVAAPKSLTAAADPARSVGRRRARTGAVIFMSSVLSGALAGLGVRWLGLELGRVHGEGAIWHTAAFGPPGMIFVFLLAGALQIGLAGAELDDNKREWLGRMGGLLMLYALLWVGIFSVAVYLPLGVAWIWNTQHGEWRQGLTLGTVLSWLGITLGGVLTGTKARSFSKQPRPEAGIDAQASSFKRDVAPKRPWSELPRDLLLKTAPYVFVVGLLALLSLGLDHLAPLVLTPGIAAHAGAFMFWHLDADNGPVLLAWISAQILLAMGLAFRVDINEFSMHHLYRNRLVRCYLGASQLDQKRNEDPFTGLDPKDDLALQRLAPSLDHIGPYQLFNTSLNLVHGEELAWQKRRASSFVMTPRYCGYYRETARGQEVGFDDYAYVPTATYTADAGDFMIGTAMAISGAAASPNMGYYSSAPLAFLMTVFNVRLGWWLPNPRCEGVRGSRGPGFGLFYLFFELFGLTNDCRGYLYLSDGGHFENLGLYELVRRRCRTIVVCDASADRKFSYDDLANAVQKCRVDFGYQIRFPDGSLQNGAPPNGVAKDDPDAALRFRAYLAQGTIDYGGGHTGTIFYLKPSLEALNDLSTDVRWYKEHVDEKFPHQSTSDQWFNEAQFESYRALGQRIASEALPDIALALGKTHWSNAKPARRQEVIRRFAERQGQSFAFADLLAEFHEPNQAELSSLLRTLRFTSADAATWSVPAPLWPQPSRPPEGAAPEQALGDANRSRAAPVLPHGPNNVTDSR